MFFFLHEECLHLKGFDSLLDGEFYRTFPTVITGDERSSTFINRLFIITTLENVFNWAPFGCFPPFSYEGKNLLGDTLLTVCSLLSFSL